MLRLLARSAALPAIALLLLAPPALGQGRMMTMPEAPVARPVPGEDPQYPRLKYADSLVSVNDRCMITKARLNPRIRAVYVNRRPLGFC